jgi:L-rhamnose mutarotase
VERLCFLLEIEAGAEDIFDERHLHIWPEMMVAMSESGYHNYSLFRAGQTVVGYAECDPDVTTAAQRMAAQPVATRWNDSMRGIVKANSPTGEVLIPAILVWHLD